MKPSWSGRALLFQWMWIGARSIVVGRMGRDGIAQVPVRGQAQIVGRALVLPEGITAMRGNLPTVDAMGDAEHRARSRRHRR
jgi:hypothetical protein